MPKSLKVGKRQNIGFVPQGGGLSPALQARSQWSRPQSQVLFLHADPSRTLRGWGWSSKARTSSGGGSCRGSCSCGGGRGGRPGQGSDSSVLAAVLEATAQLETKMELMSREQQRDHDRVEQVAQQVGQQLRNDLAGAAIRGPVLWPRKGGNTVSEH